MEQCSHGRSAPIAVITGLHDSQAGSGRHRCPVCAYVEGRKHGEAGISMPAGDTEECHVGKAAPGFVLSELPENQGGTGRHKCVICAYQAGLSEGIGAWNGKSSAETEQLTHGIGIEEFIPDEEGRKILRLHVQYERSQRNRVKAIEMHGTTCKACGFNFDDVYGGDHAAGYIEIHHIRSITELAGKTIVPETDLVPLCSNCHSMAHRKTGRILSIEEIIRLLDTAE